MSDVETGSAAAEHEAPTDAQVPASAPETEAATEGQDSQPATAPDPAPETPDPNEPPPAKGAKPWYLERIERLTAERNEERRLRIEGHAKPATEPGAEPKPAAEPGTQPDPYKLAEQIAAAKDFNSKCDAVFDRGAEAFKDWDEALGTLRSVEALSPQFVSVALETEAPEKVLHHLGKNPEEAMRLASLPLPKQAIELDRLATKLAKGPQAQVSKAPAPITPVGGGEVRRDIDLADDKTDTAAWMAARNKQLAEKRKRA